MKELQLQIEALIFAGDASVSLDEIAYSLHSQTNLEVDKVELEGHIDRIIEKYERGDFPFYVVNIGGGYRFMTKPDYHDLIVSFLKNETRKRLTKAAIETLSIIAYKQPVTRTEIENIRGVNCEYSLHKLLEKDLVEISGRDPGPGRPLIYRTTDKFMDYFGIESLEALPKVKEIQSVQNQMGEQAPIEESVEER